MATTQEKLCMGSSPSEKKVKNVFEKHQFHSKKRHWNSSLKNKKQAVFSFKNKWHQKWPAQSKAPISLVIYPRIPSVLLAPIKTFLREWFESKFLYSSEFSEWDIRIERWSLSLEYLFLFGHQAAKLKHFQKGHFNLFFTPWHFSYFFTKWKAPHPPTLRRFSQFEEIFVLNSS